MIIKSFTGPTVAAALKLVRDEMGGDAVVLKTRVLPIDETIVVNERVEVTACIDESILSPGKIDYMLQKNKKISDKISKLSGKTEISDSSAIQSDNIADNRDDKELPEEAVSELKLLRQNLIDSDISVDLTQQLIADIERLYNSDSKIKDIAGDVLTNYINQFLTSDIDFKPGMKIIFTGFSGAGKTSALAKLAAQLVSGLGMKVTLSSLDDMKVSAFEEMGSYADILNLPSAMFDELEQRQKDNSIILIDTPPLPVDPTRRQELIKKINKVNPDKTFLAVTARSRSKDLIDAVNIFRSVSPDYLIVGHLDETTRWGSIYSLAGSLKIPLAFTTNSPGGIGELARADVAEIAQTVLKNGGAV